MHPFEHGVGSFDPLTDGVLIWTRVDPTSGPVRWSVAAAPADPPASPSRLTADIVSSGEASPRAERDGCIEVEVTGLQPGTTYHYWFELDGVSSPIGRTRTLPEITDWARVAFVCCADRSMGALSAYRAIAEDEVDLVVHLGDYLYEDPKGPFEVDPPGVVVTLDDYRRRQAHTRLDPDLGALHQRHPMVFVWDDHDTADNSWRHGAKAHDPEVHGPWETRLAAATRARQEWLPTRLADPADPLDMHRSVRLGDLAELVVLDTRIPGRDLQAGDEGAKPLHDPDRRLIPEAQMEWAEERLADRSTAWAVVASQVPVARLQLPIPFGAIVDAAMPSGYKVVDGNALCTDGWDGYPVQRARLAEALDRRHGSAVVVSGDVHSNWASAIHDPSGERVVAMDFVTTAVSSTAMGEQLPAGWRAIADAMAEEATDKVWSDLRHHGYLRVDIRPDELRGDWIAVEPGEEPMRPTVIASWAVRPELPVVLREATPSSSLTEFADVRRPGLPLSTLPVPDERPSARRSFRARVRRAALVASVAALVVGVTLAARRRWR